MRAAIFLGACLIALQINGGELVGIPPTAKDGLRHLFYVLAAWDVLEAVGKSVAWMNLETIKDRVRLAKRRDG